GDFPHQRNTGAEHSCALKLGPDTIRMNHFTGIDNRVDARNPDAALAVHLQLDDRCDVAQEATVDGDPEAAAVARLLLRPAGLLRNLLDDATGAACIERVGIRPVLLRRRPRFDDTRLPENLEQGLHPIAAPKGW